VEPPEVEVEPPDVEVELPPVELPPVEVELPPVEVEPPELVLEMTTPPVELPPKKPPEKKPPPKPKPPPPEPPTTTMPPLPPLLATATGGGGGGANMGGMIVRVTVWVGAAQAIRLTVRRTTRLLEERAWRTVPLRACACLTIAGRAGGFSATWTAPPPMIAPPHVQAQSFARAILTDMRASLFQTVRVMKWLAPNSSSVAA